MKTVTKPTENISGERMIDMRRPGIIKGAVMPVSCFHVDKVSVASTSN